MKVSDADKDASAALAHELGMSAEEFTSGAADIIVQAFARHRIGSQEAAIRAAIEAAAMIAYQHEDVAEGAYSEGWNAASRSIKNAIRALSVEQIMKDAGQQKEPSQ